MIILRVLCLFLPVAGMTLFSGCVAIAAAGAGTASYAYISGTLEATIEEPVPRVQKATEKALDELEFSKIRSEGDKLAARVEYRTAQDEKVNVRIKVASESSSKVKIKIGHFGDEERSIRILDEIKGQLAN